MTSSQDMNHITRKQSRLALNFDVVTIPPLLDTFVAQERARRQKQREEQHTGEAFLRDRQRLCGTELSSHRNGPAGSRASWVTPSSSPPGRVTPLKPEDRLGD